MSENKDKVSAVPMRGMRDLLPDEVSLRRAVMTKILDVYTSYGFSEVETPVVERKELLTTGEGADNEKLIFPVMKRGLAAEDIQQAEQAFDLADGGLRFDLTVPLARYYANNQALLPSPFKSIQTGSVFRAERQQKGRYRQFTQCDIDIIGEASTIAEKELIMATADALGNIGFDDFTIRVNDRRILQSLAAASGFGEDQYDQVFIIIDKLDKIGMDGVIAELNKTFSNEDAVATLASYLNNTNQLPAECTPVLTEVNDIIEAVKATLPEGCSIVFDPTLVRGMGYYTGAIFEISANELSSSIAGGGRYDNMIGKYLRESVPACGFSIGFERIITILKERATLNEQPTKKVVIYADTMTDTEVLEIARNERKNTSIVSVQKQRKNMTQQLTELAAAGYSEYCLLQDSNNELTFRPIN
tara:strand:- start:331 stop:1581 length:1251 start_codon:yes stop_codon:yes gene_type:complete